VGVASAAPVARERVAVIDLGPTTADVSARKEIAAAVAANDLLEPVSDDALAGIAHDADEAALDAAIDRAAKAFGALDCKTTTAATGDAIGLGAARKAAGYAVPELARAWTYNLLCADRANDVDAAMTAASRLRVLGGAPAEVPSAVWAKYPEVDTLSNRDVFEVEIRADLDGAAIWIDHVKAGVSPLKISLPAGPHVIAAATADGRRGWAAGTVVRTQPKITVTTTRPDGADSAVARRVAGWDGGRPPEAELAEVLESVHARAAIVRHGDALEAWGRYGLGGALVQIGGANTLRRLADAPRLVALIAAQARAWNDHAPDPNQPLLTEGSFRSNTETDRNAPAKWWVYATIGGVLAAGLVLVLAHDHESDVQHVEVHYP
jgi:hypothetical protein